MSWFDLLAILSVVLFAGGAIKEQIYAQRQAEKEEDEIRAIIMREDEQRRQGRGF